MKSINRIALFTTLLLVGVVINGMAQSPDAVATIAFRHGSETLYAAYEENGKSLSATQEFVRYNLSSVLDSSGHLEIISLIPQQQKGNPVALNFASMRGAVVREYLKQQFPELSDIHFSFHISPNGNDNAVRVSYLPRPLVDTTRSLIYFTRSKDSVEQIQSALARYKRMPFLDENEQYTPTELDFSTLDTSFDKTETTVIAGESEDQVMVTIYYRVNKFDLDKEYITNPNTLATLDSMMKLKSASYIDSLRIVAYASPEGNPTHNQWLSQQRANTVRDYVLIRYPHLVTLQTIITDARGANWEGFRLMAAADPNLPLKQQVLSILDDPKLGEAERQRRIERLDGGKLYKSYILPNYYRYLRSGASLFVVYNPGMPVDINFEPLVIPLVEPEPEPESEPEPQTIPEPVVEVDSFRYVRPVALKTNLLFDAATLFNIELEVPIGKRFSVMAEWVFPFWGGLGNAGGVAPVPAYSEKYTLQMLSGGLEARYWFPRSRKMDERAWKWGDYNPLNGWFIGLYGGAGIYDFQWKGDGMQGDIYIATGISGGFAHPIGKHLHMEYSIGIGYLSTEYYNYTAIDGHKVVDIREDGKYDRREQNYVGPTKLKVSLVWIPRFKVKKK